MRPSLIAYACSLVVAERLRQINEKGYSPDHDDAHNMEELAAAAAFFLLPASMDCDIAHAAYEGLTMEPLSQFLALHSFPGLFRDDNEISAKSERLELYARIRSLTKGLALGMAELERVLRLYRTEGDLREIADGDGLLANRIRLIAAIVDADKFPGCHDAPQGARA